MNKLYYLVCCLFLLLTTLVQANESEAILGVWNNAEKDGYIEINSDGNMFEGIIIGGPNPEDSNRLDENNPNPKLRNRPLIGLKLLQGFKYAGNNKWTKGKIYDPNNGKTYKSNLTLNEDGTLKVRGYIGVSMFGRTETWSRK